MKVVQCQMGVKKTHSCALIKSSSTTTNTQDNISAVKKNITLKYVNSLN